MGALQAMTNWPMTGKLFSLSFLWSAGLLTRIVQGNARIIAAAPALNTRPELGQKDKDRLFLERIFTEYIGQVGLTYGALYLGQDLGAKLVQAADPRLMGPSTPSLAPAALLKAVEGKLTNADDRARFQQVLQSTFGEAVEKGGKTVKPAFDLHSTANTLYKRLYDGVSLSKFADKLGAPEWLKIDNVKSGLGMTTKVTGLLEPEVSHYFRNLNGLTNAVSFTVMLATAYLSGGPLQDWNDHWLRENVSFKLIDWWEAHNPKRPKGLEDRPLTLVSSPAPDKKPGKFLPVSLLSVASTATNLPMTGLSSVRPSSPPGFSVMSGAPTSFPPASELTFQPKRPVTMAPLPANPVALSSFQPQMAL